MKIADRACPNCGRKDQAHRLYHTWRVPVRGPDDRADNYQDTYEDRKGRTPFAYCERDGVVFIAVQGEQPRGYPGFNAVFDKDADAWVLVWRINDKPVHKAEWERVIEDRKKIGRTTDQGKDIQTRWIDDQTFQVLTPGGTVNIKAGTTDKRGKTIDDFEIVLGIDSKFKDVRADEDDREISFKIVC